MLNALRALGARNFMVAGGARSAKWEFPAFIRQAECFADAIDGQIGRGPAAATFDDGVACQAVIDAARDASRTGRWVTLAGG